MKALTTILLTLLVLSGCSKSDLPNCLGEYSKENWSNCYGERVTKNGFSYKGEYKEGLSNGFGELLFPNGGKYKGEFLNGTSHGQGTAWMADGTKQKGEFNKGIFINPELIGKELPELDSDLEYLYSLGLSDSQEELARLKGLAVEYFCNSQSMLINAGGSLENCQQYIESTFLPIDPDAIFVKEFNYIDSRFGLLLDAKFKKETFKFCFPENNPSFAFNFSSEECVSKYQKGTYDIYAEADKYSREKLYERRAVYKEQEIYQSDIQLMNMSDKQERDALRKSYFKDFSFVYCKSSLGLRILNDEICVKEAIDYAESLDEGFKEDYRRLDLIYLDSLEAYLYGIRFATLLFEECAPPENTWVGITQEEVVSCIAPFSEDFDALLINAEKFAKDEFIYLQEQKRKEKQRLAKLKKERQVRIAQEKRRAVEQQKESAAYKTGRMFGALLLASAKSKISNKIVKAMGGSEGILIRQQYPSCVYSTSNGIKYVPMGKFKVKEKKIFAKASVTKYAYIKRTYSVGRCPSRI